MLRFSRYFCLSTWICLHEPEFYQISQLCSVCAHTRCTHRKKTKKNGIFADKFQVRAGFYLHAIVNKLADKSLFGPRPVVYPSMVISHLGCVLLLLFEWVFGMPGSGRRWARQTKYCINIDTNRSGQCAVERILVVENEAVKCEQWTSRIFMRRHFCPLEYCDRNK